ncbi:ATP-dependent permease [Coniothyrium glycines]
MATTSTAPGGSSEAEKAGGKADEEQHYLHQVGWKALFSFTTKKHVPVICGAVLAATIAALTMPVFAVLYGLIFREYTSYGAGLISSEELIDNVSRCCVMLTGVAALNWISNSIYFSLFLAFGELQARSARDKVFDSLMKKDMAWYDTHETGVLALLPAVQSHIRDLQLSVSAPLGEVVQALMQSLASLGVALYFSWNLTLVIMSSVPVIYLVQTFLANRMAIRADKQSHQLRIALKVVTSAIQSIETVKCFNGERSEIQTFTKLATLAANLYRSVANVRSLQIGVMRFFEVSVFVQGFYYGSHLMVKGKIDAGDVLTTFWATLMAIAGITMILPQFVVLQQGRLAGARLRLLMEQASTRDQRQEFIGQLRPTRCKGDIEIREVTFSYPSRADDIAVRNASLFFPAGETTFVIGKSGSGKSTLGQLLVRLYQPNSGEIFLDGLDLSSLDVRWLRKNVLLMEQQSVLFDDSIRSNVALGCYDKSVDLRDICNAIKFAMLETLAQDLPEGLETQLGLAGSSLSGGQKQRMALARARVRDAPVMILDEATSALDYVTRSQVLLAIREWRRGKTTVIITHDISQIQESDFVYLMNDKEVLQEGYRKELEYTAGPFQTFLTSEHESTDDSFSEYSQDDEDEADRIMSMYQDFHPTRMAHRPLSVALFGPSILQNFVRDSWADNALAKRNTMYEDGDGNDVFHSTRASIASDIEIPTVDSLMPRPAPAAMLKIHQSRRSSLEKHADTSFSKEIRPRPDSWASSRRISGALAYPRRLSVAHTTPSQRIQSPKNSRKMSLSKKLSRKHIISEYAVPDTSSGALSIMHILRSVWPTLNWQSRLVLFGAICCACIHAAATPVFAWVFSQLLATFSAPGNPSSGALKYAVTILGIAITDGLASYLMYFLADSAAQSWTLVLKTEAFRRILLQPRGFFDAEENSLSCLAETLDHFAEEARNLPGRFACDILVVGLMVPISIFWSLIVAWKLALAALATAPVIIGLAKSYNLISSRWESRVNGADDNFGKILHETFVNIRTVRCLVLEEYFRKKSKTAAKSTFKIGLKRAVYSGSIFGPNYVGAICVGILLFWYGGLLVSKNEYTVKAIVECFLVLMLSITHAGQIAAYMTQINISRLAGARVLRLARMPTTSHELTGSIKIETVGDICFNHVNFAYPSRPDVPVLHDVSFVIPQGSCTAIAGSSGAGKSTIASLLLKLYQSHPGALRIPADLSISGHNIEALDTTTLRSRIAVVSQNPVIFPGSIADNIIYGLSPSASEAEPENIRAAARGAGISDFISSLPQGYQTLIGEGGTGLSGGQAQRLVIARALVRNPDILILDEATSALDAASANIIRETISKLVKDARPNSEATLLASPPVSPRFRSGRFWDDKDWGGYHDYEGKGKLNATSAGTTRRKQMTVIIITHAQEMMSIADHIIMLDQGRVVEQGPFAELSRRKGGAFGRLLRGERE